jgi:signal transduction histidine kinase/DNA-binding response OmpR family regulator
MRPPPCSLLALLLVLVGASPRAEAAPRAADPGWAVEQWRTTDGLPANSIYSLAVDELGRLVMGTADGLGLYDGVRFTISRVGGTDAPPDDRVLWVGTDPDDGALWLVTEAGRVQRRHDGVVRDYGQLGGGTQPVGVQEWTGEPLVLTDAGVYTLDDPPTLRADLRADTYAVLADGEGTWVAWRDRVLHRTRPDAPFVEGPRFVDGQDLLAQPLGAAYAARAARSRFTFDAAGVSWDGRLVLPIDAPVRDVLEVNGDAWVATIGDGLYRIRHTPVRVHRPPTTLTRTDKVLWDGLAGAIWGSLKDDQGWWDPRAPVPAYTSWRWRRGGRLEPIQPLPTEGMLPIAMGGARWWNLTGVGLYRQASGDGGPVLVLDADSGVPTCVAPLQATHTHGDGSITLGTGFASRDGAWEGLPGRCAPPFAGVRASIELPGEGLGFGGTTGFALLPPDGGAPVSLPAPDGARARHLRLGAGWLWMATEEYGLCGEPVAALRTGAWRCLDRSRGFPETQVHASVADELGRVWISTNRGLLVADARALTEFAEGLREEVPTVALADHWGLVDPELNGFAGFSTAADPDGSDWFPSQDGLVQVIPGDLHVPAQVPVHLARVAVGTTSFPTSAPLPTLSPGHDVVHLELALADLTWADQVELRYRLGEQPWQPTGTVLELQALPPGATTLEIQSRLLGDWSPALTMPFYRQPAFTERLAFPLSVGIGAIALLAGAIALRNRSLRARGAALAREVERQTGELAATNTTLRAQADELRARNETISAQAARLSALDELKRKFIADLAHELRTPLTLLIGALEGPRGDVAAARRNAARLHTLVDELFDLSRLESGTLRLRARHMDLGAFASELVVRFAGDFEAAGRRLSFAGPAAPVLVWADPGLLEKVLGNLLVNARRHGRGAVAVRVRATDDHAVVLVRDEGPGIPAELREQIFERFVQASTGDARAHDGAGIGLALVRELVELHGGEAHVVAGDHTVFEVTLPLGQAHLALDEVEPSPSGREPWTPEGPAPADPDGARPAVLLVEDNDDLRAFVAGLLESRWTVRQARDGREGLASALADPPAAIVSDVRMPEMDGLSMARALRQHAATADVPLLFLSAKTQPEDRVEGLALARDYLCKPFGSAELVARVENLVRRSDPPTVPSVPARPEHVQAILARLDAVVSECLGDSEFGVERLAQRLGMSVRTLQTRMNELELATPAAFILEARLREAQRMLRVGTYSTVGEVAAAVGLSRSYFSRAYRAWAGRPPGEEPGAPGG